MIAFCVMAVIAFILVIIKYILSRILNSREIQSLKDEQKTMWHTFEQTASMLAIMIDSRDEHTNGHSKRVAEYSVELARLAGKNEKECREIYFTAILHDVGKLEDIEKHSEIGGERLSMITDFPFLSDGARYHHERYDGSGYPKGLKGNNIPEVARIIAIADTYDFLTSKGTTHDILPQNTVREEFIKGAGVLYDPEYSKYMINMIDKDTEYQMREKGDSDSQMFDVETDLSKTNELVFKDYKDLFSDGIRVTENKTKVRFEVEAEELCDKNISIPTIILFDSLDGLVHKDDRGIRILNYLEYGEIWVDGHTICTSARDINSHITDINKPNKGIDKYELEIVKYDDHARVKIITPTKKIDAIIALPDAVRFVYFSITGEHCKVKNISITVSDDKIDETYIPRIAEKVSYIDHLEGDIPNTQIIGYRASYTKPIPIAHDMKLSFHTTSLPTANLLWHCAYILIYSSENGKLTGTKYKELACIRLDGEDATNNGVTENNLTVHKNDEFISWDEWKQINKTGFECDVIFKRRKNKIILITENQGISIKNVTTLPSDKENIYVALTGDQCALTDIRIR